MRKLFLLLAVMLFLAVPSICSAGILDHPKVAVLPLEDQSARKLSQTTLDKAGNFILDELRFSNRFTMPERNMEQIQRVLDELKFQRSGLVEQRDVKSLGKFFGAEYLVFASITGFSANTKGKGKYVAHVSIRVIEVETASIALAGRGTGTGDDEYEALENTVMDAMDGKRGIFTLLKGGKR